MTPRPDRDAVLDPRPVRRIVENSDVPRGGGWPYSIPAVAALLDDGLELDRITVLVGENGTGKSSIIEGVAMAYGLGGEGGSVNSRHSTWASESPLYRSLRLIRGGGASRWGYFLRAESLHGLFTHLQNHLEPIDFHARSHGEGFWAMLDTSRFADDGFFVLDEPESGLSLDGQLRLVATLAEMGESIGAQVLLATHSPILASVPGATVYEISDAGIARTTWEDLAMVDHHRRYLEAPEAYLRHLLG